MLKLFLKFGIIGLFFMAGCKGTFTSRELKLIENGDGIMRVRKINDPEDSLFLRQRSNELTLGDIKMKVYQTLKRRMLATVNDSTDPGVGIAAPQVGIGKRLIAVQRYDKPGTPFEFYINPQIEHASESKSLGKEGCLSVSDIVGEVWRSDELVISYIPDLMPSSEMLFENKTDSILKKRVQLIEDNRRVRDTVRGFTAVIFQHEIDHLDGTLFIDKMLKDSVGIVKE